MAWQEVKQANHPRPYYYDSETRKTTWVKPVELYTPEELEIHSKGWMVLTTEQGKVYYSNVSLKKSSWTFPSVSNEEKKQQEQQQQEEKTIVDPGKLDSSNVSKDDEQKELKNEEKQADTGNSDILDLSKLNEKYHTFSQISNLSKVGEEKVTEGDKTNKETLNQNGSEDFESQFIQMLKDHEIDSTWSFQRIVDDLSTKDPRYWSEDMHNNSNPLQKKKLFEEYLNNRTEEELLKEKVILENFKKNFIEILNKYTETGDIKYYSRWMTVKRNILINEPIFKNSTNIDDSLKRKIFQDFINGLKKKNHENVDKLKEKAFIELDSYFETILQKYSSNDNEDYSKITDWSYIMENYLYGNKQFESNKNFKNLNNLDIFKEYLKVLEKRYIKAEEKFKNLQEEKYTQQRVIRDEYLQLLESLKIYPTTKWEDVYDKLQKNETFQELLKVNPKSPMDYFHFHLETINVKIQSVINGFQQYLKKDLETFRESSKLFEGKTINEVYKDIFNTHKHENNAFTDLDDTEVDILLEMTLSKNKDIIKDNLNLQLQKNGYKYNDVQEFLESIPEFDKFVFSSDNIDTDKSHEGTDDYNNSPMGEFVELYNSYIKTRTNNASTASQHGTKVGSAKLPLRAKRSAAEFELDY